MDFERYPNLGTGFAFPFFYAYLHKILRKDGNGVCVLKHAIDRLLADLDIKYPLPNDESWEDVVPQVCRRFVLFTDCNPTLSRDFRRHSLDAANTVKFPVDDCLQLTAHVLPEEKLVIITSFCSVDQVLSNLLEADCHTENVRRVSQQFVNAIRVLLKEEDGIDASYLAFLEFHDDETKTIKEMAKNELLRSSHSRLLSDSGHPLDSPSEFHLDLDSLLMASALNLLYGFILVASESPHFLDKIDCYYFVFPRSCNISKVSESAKFLKKQSCFIFESDRRGEPKRKYFLDKYEFAMNKVPRNVFMEFPRPLNSLQLLEDVKGNTNCIVRSITCRRAIQDTMAEVPEDVSLSWKLHQLLETHLDEYDSKHAEFRQRNRFQIVQWDENTPEELMRLLTTSSEHSHQSFASLNKSIETGQYPNLGSALAVSYVYTYLHPLLQCKENQNSALKRAIHEDLLPKLDRTRNFQLADNESWIDSTRLNQCERFYLFVDSDPAVPKDLEVHSSETHFFTEIIVGGKSLPVRVFREEKLFVVASFCSVDHVLRSGFYATCGKNMTAQCSDDVASDAGRKISKQLMSTILCLVENDSGIDRNCLELREFPGQTDDVSIYEILRRELCYRTQTPAPSGPTPVSFPHSYFSLDTESILFAQVLNIFYGFISLAILSSKDIPRSEFLKNVPHYHFVFPKSGKLIALRDLNFLEEVEPLIFERNRPGDPKRDYRVDRYTFKKDGVREGFVYLEIPRPLQALKLMQDSLVQNPDNSGIINSTCCADAIKKARLPWDSMSFKLADRLIEYLDSFHKENQDFPRSTFNVFKWDDSDSSALSEELHRHLTKNKVLIH